MEEGSSGQQSRPSALRAVAGQHSDRMSKEDEDATGELNYYGFAPHTQPAAKSEQPNYACDILNTRLPTLCKRYAHDSISRSARRERTCSTLSVRTALRRFRLVRRRRQGRHGNESLPDVYCPIFTVVCSVRSVL
jgi:hypothetical protein